MRDIENTVKERGNRYGSMVDNANLTQALMTEINLAAAHAGQTLSPTHKECLHMIVHKISRMVIGDQWYSDNPHDISGYAKLLEDYIEETMDEGDTSD
tara:strand:+ start:603 stop:896 length:294 start_codon:yes stop_codon:yes gene_type:complete